MIIDLTPLVQALAALALAAVTGVTPYLMPLMRRYLHIRLTATQASAIQSAADAGAKAAYGYIVTNAASYRDTVFATLRSPGGYSMSWRRHRKP